MLSSSLFTSALAIFASIGLGNAATYSNPLRSPDGSDPFMVYTGGYYYFMTTTWNDIQISRATTLEGLKTAPKKVVYSASCSSRPTRCANVWAPEVHWINEKWYIYYTAGVAANLDGQRVHVLTGSGNTPWDAFTYTGQLTNQWSIDGSIVRFNGFGNYLAFSCMNGGQYQSICMAPMKTPTTAGAVTVISTPDQAWEQHGTPVNEAPIALYNAGKTFIAYSGSYCWTPNYALGLLTWDGKTDPSKKAAWAKKGPVLSSAAGNYGTGHNGFFTSPDGKEQWVIYNAASNSAGACDASRYASAQKLSFNSDGSPKFATPVKPGTTLTGPSGE